MTTAATRPSTCDRRRPGVPVAAPGPALGVGQDRARRPRPRPRRARLRARVDRRHGPGAARRRPAGDRRRRRHRLAGDARRPGQDAPPADPRRPPRRPPAGGPPAAAHRAPASPRSSSSSSTSTRSPRRLERPGITVDELIEEIDIGGPSMVRAAAKNHANVAIVTSPARYDAILAALDAPDGAGRPAAPGAGARGVRPHGRVRRPDRRRAARRASPRPACSTRPDDPYPPTLTIALEKVETLRYGENPHQPAARYRRPGATARRRAVRRRRAAAPGQGALVQQRARRGRRAALGRALRGPGVVIVKHTNPCGAAERPTLARRLGGGPGGRPGQRVRWRRRADPPGRSRRSPRP